ncbi:type II toxin-antitoxin system RelE/ParE family toxin [Arenibacter sp. GZD96]|uniref:type II toxin-antitoxin system RelE/ParE family toxin n=1 Tax=Aurantibrevibacter litoralis TaxID=3106030 RepID=UPI002AFF53DA|nr:type II toxin-antitoxin system RelE/ParE family toxin [Arenibacter sp. GZD-96]MEA1786105.1 type II toxin-antitoxin system RelE/ParE family toxin [Arenibacter sp. GZD-96]
MALKIVWAPQAEKGLGKVLEYLEEEWSAKEILVLEKRILDLMERISKYPKICPPTGKYPNVHKGSVDKNNYIIYRLNPRKKSIEIINFRGTKQKPIK